MVDPSHVAAVGPAAAILFARIVYRAGDAGEWRATREHLAAETGLTAAMIRTAVDVLRRREWVATRRTSTLDSTLIWSPIFAGQAERSDPPSRDSENRTPPPAISAIPSIETGKDLPPTPSGEGGLFTPPVLTVVPEAPVKKPSRAKPKRPLPADFRPSPAHFDLARDLGVDLRHEGPQFTDYHTAKGSTFANWDAALNTWIRNAAKFAERNGRGRPAPVIPSPVEEYDPAYEASLPPPPSNDLFGLFG